MGIEYQIHDLKNKQRFDLGKGPYGIALYIWLLEAEIKTLDTLTDAIYLEFEERYKEEPDLADIAYIKDVVAKIWKFCEEANWQVEVRNDCLFYENADERYNWPIVQSRYDLYLRE